MTTAMSYLSLENWESDAKERGLNVFFNGYDHYIAYRPKDADYGSFNIETQVGILCSDPLEYKGVKHTDWTWDWKDE